MSPRARCLVAIIAFTAVVGFGRDATGAPSPPPDPDPTPIYASFGEFPPQPPPPPALHVRSQTDDVVQAGPYTETATCMPAETLLGGGFETGTRQAANRAFVTGDFPSGPGTWTATFLAAKTAVPKNAPPVDRFVVNQVTSYAYCLDSSGIPVTVRDRVFDNAAVPVTPPGLESFTGYRQSMTVDCPVGMFAVGGGFAVDGSTVTDGLFNAGISSSIPKAGPRGFADGWHIDVVALEPPRPTRVYVRCTADLLTPVSLESKASDLSNSVPAIAIHHFVTTCLGVGVATAGGFAYQGDPLIGHPVSASRSKALQDPGRFEDTFASWIDDELLAYETPQYLPNDQARLCQNDPSYCVANVSATNCVVIPPLPRLTVQITSPPSGYAFPWTPSGTTPKIAFTALVRDETGAIVPHPSLTWSIPGTGGLGGGSPLIARLPATGGGVPVKVVAFVAVGGSKFGRRGRYATDSITVNTGYPPIP